MKVKVLKKSRLPEEKISISSDFIKLDALLKYACLVGTGGEAKLLIQDGLVRVNGEVCLQRGKKVFPGDLVVIEGKALRVEKAE